MLVMVLMLALRSVDSPPVVELLSYPFSKATSFGLEDFKELIGMLQEVLCSHRLVHHNAC
jgi:hypothetical protein